MQEESHHGCGFFTGTALNRKRDVWGSSRCDMFQSLPTGMDARPPPWEWSMFPWVGINTKTLCFACRPPSRFSWSSRCTFAVTFRPLLVDFRPFFLRCRRRPSSCCDGLELH